MKFSKNYLNATSLILFGCIVGCTGPKLMSTEIGINQIWETGQTPEAISIRIFKDEHTFKEIEGKRMGDHLLDALAEELDEEAIFNSVEKVDFNDSLNTPLLLEVKIMNIGMAGLGGRAMGAKSGFFTAGRLINTDKDKVILTFSQTRVGTGGPVVVGGLLGALLTARENKMIKQLMHWVSEDIAGLVEDSLDK